MNALNYFHVTNLDEIHFSLKDERYINIMFCSPGCLCLSPWTVAATRPHCVYARPLPPLSPCLSPTQITNMHCIDNLLFSS